MRIEASIPSDSYSRTLYSTARQISTQQYTSSKLLFVTPNLTEVLFNDTYPCTLLRRNLKLYEFYSTHVGQSSSINQYQCQSVPTDKVGRGGGVGCFALTFMLQKWKKYCLDIRCK